MMSRVFPSFRKSIGLWPEKASFADRSHAGIFEVFIDSLRIVDSSSRSRSCRGLLAAPAFSQFWTIRKLTPIASASSVCVSPKCSRNCRVRAPEARDAVLAGAESRRLQNGVSRGLGLENHAWMSRSGFTHELAKLRSVCRCNAIR